MLGPKIVILEDDRSSCALISAFLEKAGFQILEAHEGRYAIERVMKEHPALLIADVLLPDMHGSEVVKQLMATAFGGELKALFLTSLLSKNGSAGQETKLRVGGREFPALAKPFKPQVLLDIVKRIVGDPEELAAAREAVEDAVAEQSVESDEVGESAAAETAVESDDASSGEKAEPETSTA